MSSRHPYVLWRRVALWSNSSTSARVIFWGGCFAAAWGAGIFTMQMTNKATYDPDLQKEIAKRKTSEDGVQTDLAQQQLQRLLTDIEKGDDQKRGWKPR